MRRKKQLNSKVRNATPNEYDGIKFRSKLETYTYKKLKEANIMADYEMHRYYLYSNNIGVNFYIVHNQKEVDELIKKLKK